MFKLDPVIDRDEALIIARRRRTEEERKKRFFDPRTRLLGVDVKALERQVNEKKDLHNEENTRNKIFDNDRIRNDQIALLLEKRLQHDRQEINESINRFRRECQRPDLRREFDLNDPDALKKSLPARINDDDPRCTVSSIQKFEGEDLNGEIRAIFQKKQLRNWLMQQKHLRKEADKLQKEADDLYFSKMVEIDRRAVEIQRAERACRQAIEIAAKNYNSALAKQKAKEKMFEKQQEMDDDFMEISNAIFGDILNEKPDDESDACRAKRLPITEWKGFTPQQRAEIYRIQKEQLVQKQMLREKEEKGNKEWDEYMKSATKAAIVKEFEERRRRFEERKRLLMENQQLAEEQKTLKNYLDTEVYVGLVAEEFYKQFNTSSR